MDAIKETHNELSTIEFDIARTEVRPQAIHSQLRPVSSLSDELQRPATTNLAARGPPWTPQFRYRRLWL